MFAMILWRLPRKDAVCEGNSERTFTNVNYVTVELLNDVKVL